MIRYLYALLVLCAFTSCGAYLNQPVTQKQARIGELTPKSKTLKNLPGPTEPIVVGVYNFKDQTGQYKSVENGSTFSTAVSQGATTMLIKALEDSNWFTPIERENLNNLLNERNIIRSTRKEFAQTNNTPQPRLKSLLFAGVLLEGGIISYDSNILTGGYGARYFGVGGSTQYRQDRLTIYLRAVSTANGKILKTVYVSKTVLSQAIDASLFRYVNFQRLLEVETGITKNEPVQLAMKDAIEKAVESLIMEGIEDNLWATEAGEATDKELVALYNLEKEAEESTLLYDRKQTPVETNSTLNLSGYTTYFQSDYSRKPLSYGVSLSYSRRLNDKLGVVLKGGYFNLETGSTYKEPFINLDLNLEAYFLPYDDISPFIYGGAGILYNADERFNMKPKIRNLIKAQVGLGVDARVSKDFSIRAFAEGNLVFMDELDRIEAGERDDFYYVFGVGLNYHFGGRGKSTKKEIIDIEPIKESEE